MDWRAEWVSRPMCEQGMGTKGSRAMAIATLTPEKCCTETRRRAILCRRGRGTGRGILIARFAKIWVYEGLEPPILVATHAGAKVSR